MCLNSGKLNMYTLIYNDGDFFYCKYKLQPHH